MTRFLYIAPDGDQQTGAARAIELGCGYFPHVPAEFEGVKTPCVILQGAGKTIVIPDIPPTDVKTVEDAWQPLVAAEEQAGADAPVAVSVDDLAAAVAQLAQTAGIADQLAAAIPSLAPALAAAAAAQPLPQTPVALPPTPTPLTP